MNIFKKILGDDNYEDETMENNDTDMGYELDEETGTVSRPRPQFILVKPDRRDELLSIADSLLDRKTVILNMELVKTETHRFIDFLSGVAYALNGQVKKVASNTFLIIPGGLEISGDIFEDLENEF